MQKIGFDIISDLYLNPGDVFDWTGKSTSLYCIVAGNISNDLKTLDKTIYHLTKFYQGVFVTLGALEYQGLEEMIDERTHEILLQLERHKNVAVLHHHVVIVDGIAVLGANGWYGTCETEDIVQNAMFQVKRYEDISYLHNSIEKLQKHLDVKRIVMVTNCVPNTELYFGETPEMAKNIMPMDSVLEADTEKKIKDWVFGTHGKIVDTVISGINYCNNPKYERSPYWAKRITIEV